MEIKQRVNRIIGQLKGIEKMVEQERECVDVLQQVSAVKKAIDGLSKEILSRGVCQLVDEEDKKKVEAMLERAISL